MFRFEVLYCLCARTNTNDSEQTSIPKNMNKCVDGFMLEYHDSIFYRFWMLLSSLSRLSATGDRCDLQPAALRSTARRLMHNSPVRKICWPQARVAAFLAYAIMSLRDSS